MRKNLIEQNKGFELIKKKSLNNTFEQYHSCTLLSARAYIISTDRNMYMLNSEVHLISNFYEGFLLKYMDWSLKTPIHTTSNTPLTPPRTHPLTPPWHTTHTALNTPTHTAPSTFTLITGGLILELQSFYCTWCAVTYWCIGHAVSWGQVKVRSVGKK